MIIKHEYPPLIDEIDAAFHVRGKPIVFSWGDTIYNPAGGQIAPQIIAHEQVHGERQVAYPNALGYAGGLSSIVAWWSRYIADPAFRLEEEIPAHIREYEVYSRGTSRHDRRFYLTHVAHKLSSPLYGSLISYFDAKTLIKDQAART